MKTKESEDFSEDLDSEIKDKMEDDGGITPTTTNIGTSPNIISSINTTPKSNAVMGRFPMTHKTPNVIEIITPGQTPEVGRGLFECGKFPESSAKGKEILENSISMRNINFTCDVDYIPDIN